MAELNVQKASITGISPVFSPADVAGDTFTNYGNTILQVDNQDTVAKTVTIASNPCNFGGVHDVVVSVPAGEERVIGTFDQKRFNQEVSVSYDDVVSLNVAVIKY